MQTIPGRLEFEQYDEGGEGIAYHDQDSVNNGSGKLNPVNGNPLNEFRLKEGVDISYTKDGGIDDNPYNKVMPAMKSLYVGWTAEGEWINYTVNVKKNGTYNASLQYTANNNSLITIDVDNKNSIGNIPIPSTHDDADTVAWRQWHHWNRIDSLFSIRLTKGAHTLRLRLVKNGDVNFDHMDLL